jgi:hypothetical protein
MYLNLKTLHQVARPEICLESTRIDTTVLWHSYMQISPRLKT